jgi:AraC-like DNA-binding protein
VTGLQPSRLGDPAPDPARGRDCVDGGMPGFAGMLARPAAPTAHVSVARLVLAGLAGEDGDCGALARQADLPACVLAGDSDRVPAGCLSRLWRLGLAGTNDPCLGVKAASQWRFGRLHLMDYLFVAAATLAEAITGLVRYSALLNTAANEVRLSDATVSYQVRSGDPDVDAVASQFALGVVLSLARHAVGREVRPLRLRLVSAAPSRYRELADRFGVHRIEFGAERSTMTLAAADLSLPLPGADAPLAAVLREHAVGVIAAQAAASIWADGLRQFIAAHLADDGLSLPAAARRLALSPRSLQRRLQEEGTTWREILDTARRDRAAVLLPGGLSRTAVAARLGFSDARALRGALRRWGVS